MTSLAKINRPRLFGVVARERLFKLLDERRRHPALCVSGPPGAGKTTLIVSYLDARKFPTLWYQIDSGDSDLATFFYYLRLASGSMSRKSPPLPLLTPEYLPDIAGFARRYFRALFDRLPKRAVIVFDNYQELPAESPLHALIADAISEVPEGVNVIVVSRAEPPPEFARLASNHALQRLGWEDLRLSLDETRDMVALDGGLDDSVVQSLHEQSDGWATGAVLLARRYRRTGAARLEAKNPDATFDYFEGEILKRAGERAQNLLLRTAWLPRFTAAMAEEISREKNAGKLLNALCRQHSLTSRSGGAEPVYQYHALLREFLIARATDTCPDASSVIRSSAGLLDAHGASDDAFDLYAQVEDWDAATRIILSRAPVLLGQGCWQMLHGWISRLEKNSVAANPWLLFWSGCCEAQTQPPVGRAALERAYARFVETQEPLGQALSAASVIECYNVEWADLAPLDRWIGILEDLLAKRPDFPSPEMELRVWSSLLYAMAQRKPPGFIRSNVRRACLAVMQV
ncbi:MAG: AAA family ATPase [Burkholderiales bacterium]